MLYATQGDPVPYSQAQDMWQALTMTFPSLEVDLWIMNYAFETQHDHAYKYWPAENDAIGSDGECVHDEVIAFLQAH